MPTTISSRSSPWETVTTRVGEMTTPLTGLLRPPSTRTTLVPVPSTIAAKVSDKSIGNAMCSSWEVPRMHRRHRQPERKSPEQSAEADCSGGPDRGGTEFRSRTSKAREKRRASDLDDPHLGCAHDGLDPLLRAHLLENRIDVELGRVLADLELGGNLLVGEPFGQERQHL